jgi:hypothetical protein
VADNAVGEILFLTAVETIDGDFSKSCGIKKLVPV